MGSMAHVTRLVPADLLRILLRVKEVPSVNVINIAVIVVIDVVVRDLCCVHPHVLYKVRMSILDTLVAHGNDDSRITSGKTPGILDIDVGAGP